MSKETKERIHYKTENVKLKVILSVEETLQTGKNCVFKMISLHNTKLASLDFAKIN